MNSIINNYVAQDIISTEKTYEIWKKLSTECPSCKSKNIKKNQKYIDLVTSINAYNVK